MIRGTLLAALSLLLALGLWKGVPTVAEALRIDTCLDRGGRYDYAARQCDFGSTSERGQSAADSAGRLSVTDTIRIRKRSVIAYFAETQAEVDDDPNAMEALADFQFYLRSVEKGLASCGVDLFETYARRVVLDGDKWSEEFIPGELEVRVGYRLLRPDLTGLSLEGVHADVGLLAAVTEHFKLAEDCWHPGSEPA